MVSGTFLALFTMNQAGMFVKYRGASCSVDTIIAIHERTKIPYAMECYHVGVVAAPGFLIAAAGKHEQVITFNGYAGIAAGFIQCFTGCNNTRKHPVKAVVGVAEVH